MQTTSADFNYLGGKIYEMERIVLRHAAYWVSTRIFGRRAGHVWAAVRVSLVQ